MKISVFGGSQSLPGDSAYLEAMELGRLLVVSGHEVLTGGYIGTMEAVSRGAAEAGGHVIGVTCAEIERWRPVGANAWVAEEWRMETLLERLQALIFRSAASLALPGGPGTMTEICLTWNLMIVGALPRRPLILIGDGWRKVFDTFFGRLGTYTPGEQHRLLAFAADSSTAVRELEMRIHEKGVGDDRE